MASKPLIAVELAFAYEWKVSVWAFGAPAPLTNSLEWSSCSIHILYACSTLSLTERRESASGWSFSTLTAASMLTPVRKGDVERCGLPTPASRLPITSSGNPFE